MSKINLPGFSAEASLSEIRRSYRTNGVVSVSTDLVVVPQLRPFSGATWGTVSVSPKTLEPVYFQCGFNPKTLSSECTCSGDADCNGIFASGFCGENASCDTGTGTCRCDLKL